VKRALFIANSAARGEVGRADAAVALAVAAGWEATLLRTEARGHAVLLAADAAAAGTDLVVSVGGDGTTREVAAGLCGTGSVLAIVPAGTGNSSYRELFGTVGWEELLDAALRGAGRRAVDLTLVEPTGEYSLLGFSVGWLAQVVELASADGEHSGPAKYALAAREAAAAPRHFEARVTVDGTELVEGPLGLVAVGGARIRGAVFPLLPDSSTTDGLLDVISVDAADSDTFTGLLEAVLAGTHRQSPLVRTARGRTVGISSAGPLPAEVDGDLWGRDAVECRLTAVAGALNVVDLGGP
jgi:diacylglycerol kinase (ATP)